MQGTDLITVSKTEETIDATSGLSLTKAFIGSVNATFTDEGEGLDLGLTTLNLERNATTAAATGTFTLDIGFTELAGTTASLTLVLSMKTASFVTQTVLYNRYRPLSTTRSPKGRHRQ
jgi:hypothetical protein